MAGFFNSLILAKLKKPLRDWLVNRALRLNMASRAVVRKRIPVLTDDDFEYLTEYLANNAISLIDDIKL